MSALFNFHSFLTVVLLVICTCTFLKMQFPTFLEQKTGEKFLGTPRSWRNGAFSSYIYGRPNMNLMSGPHHECKRREHHSLYSRRTFRGFFWKAARIGERLSPWVAAGCFTMGVSIIFF